MSESIIKMTDGVIRQQKKTILKNVNIEIRSGEFVYLIGKVGSGKSSLLKTLYAELPLEYGNAEVAGFQLKKIKKSQIPLLRRKCGIVFQDFKLLIDRNVYENLEFVLRATGWKNKKAIRERIETVLEKVGMTDKQRQMPHQLSGGEQQRIVLARALLNAPPLILADEPTGNIDPETSYRLIELLKEICSTGKTIVIATHQYDLIEKYPGRIFCCENGELYEKTSSAAPVNVAATSPAEEAFPDTRSLPEVLPADLETPSEEEQNLSGDETGSMAITTEFLSATEETTEHPETKEDIHSSAAGEKSTFPEEEPETQEILPEEDSRKEEEEEDIMKLIGKLDYPEISTFDYEIPDLPETTGEETPAENTTAPETPEMPGQPGSSFPATEPLQESEVPEEDTGSRQTPVPEQEPQPSPAEPAKEKVQPPKSFPPVFDLDLD